MKFSKETKTILDNFSTINNSILFLEGKKQRTMTLSKSILAEAEIGEDIPKEFGVHDLSKFLSVLSLFEDPSLSFDDTSLGITEGTTKANYTFADPKVIKYPPKDRNITLPSIDEAFELKADDLAYLLKSAKVLGAPHFVIEGDGTSIRISVRNNEKPSADSLSRVVGTTSDNFAYVLDIDALKVLLVDYDVSISSVGMVNMVSKSATYKMSYWLPVQKK